MAGEWRAERFGRLALLVRDTVHPSDAPGLPYIGLEHIGEGTLQLLGTGTAKDASSLKSRFSAGDILFGKLRPYFRKVIRAPFDGICSTDIWVVRPQSGVDSGFLFYLMASDLFLEPVVRASEGTKMPRAKWEYATSLVLPCPPLPEQRAIAHILGTLDDRIELNRRQSKTLEAMAQALFKSWFVDFEPVRAKSRGDLDGRPRWQRGESLPGLPADLYDLFPDRLVESELGPIPEGWEVKKFGELCYKPQYGFTASAQDKAIGPKFLRITDINKLSWIEWASVPYCEINLSEFEQYKVHYGDVLIARMADPGHGVMIEEEEVNAVFASYLIRFRPQQTYYARYIQYWLRSILYWKLVETRKAGTTRASLNAQEISRFVILVPPEPALQIFDQLVTELRNKVVANVKETETLAALRDTLLPKLISGQLRVAEAERFLQERGL